LWRALNFAPAKLFFDHLGQVVIAIVMLKDLDQLRIRQRLKRNDSAILSLVVQSVHAAPLSRDSSLELPEGSEGHPQPPALLSRMALGLLH
jgi:hypothetical protein